MKQPDPSRKHRMKTPGKMSPKESNRIRSSDLVVDLEELEWVKVLEITVPPALVWIGLINMLCPAQFDRVDLGLLIDCIREHAATVKRPHERATLKRVADKMERAIQLPPPSPPASLAASHQLPNNKQTVLKTMRKDLRQWKRSPTPNNPFNVEHIRFIEGLIGPNAGPP